VKTLKDEQPKIGEEANISYFYYSYRASYRDRRLRRKEYADRIRVAAATTAVAIDRWAELASRLYDDIQALITETDVLLVKKQDIIEARDFLWRGLVEARAISSRRMLDEKLDSAYVGLYGYAPGVQKLYIFTLTSLKQADDLTYDRLLNETQDEVFSLKQADNFEARLSKETQQQVRDRDINPSRERSRDPSMAEKPFQSAELGNLIRGKVADLRKSFNLAAAESVSVFRNQMVSLITATDSEIFHKTYPQFSEMPPGVAEAHKGAPWLSNLAIKRGARFRSRQSRSSS
jgi:hypothetical protein